MTRLSSNSKNWISTSNTVTHTMTGYTNYNYDAEPLSWFFFICLSFVWYLKILNQIVVLRFYVQNYLLTFGADVARITFSETSIAKQQTTNIIILSSSMAAKSSAYVDRQQPVNNNKGVALLEADRSGQGRLHRVRPISGMWVLWPYKNPPVSKR